MTRLVFETKRMRVAELGDESSVPDLFGELTTQNSLVFDLDEDDEIYEGYGKVKSAFPYLIENRFPTPCHQCVVMENGKLSTCGRCIDVPGLCDQCGYFFVAEYTLLFRGNPKIIIEMLHTYLKYI